MTNPIITIDGPSGSGKGTLSYLLAKKLGWQLLDSGAIYRLCALFCINSQIDPDDEAAVTAAAKQLSIRFETTDSGVDIYLGSDIVNSQIRAEDIGMTASKIAAYNGVRSALLDCQRDFATTAGLVADGRDMGTVVFPEAPVKFYLTASAKTRADRRMKQLTEQGVACDYSDILQSIEKRDYQDQNRKVAPLVPAADAVVIDSSEISIDDVLACMTKTLDRL